MNPAGIGARCVVCGQVRWHDPGAAPMGVSELGQFEVGPNDDPNALVWASSGLAAVACGHHPPAEAQHARVKLGGALVRARDFRVGPGVP